MESKSREIQWVDLEDTEKKGWKGLPGGIDTEYL